MIAQNRRFASRQSKANKMRDNHRRLIYRRSRYRQLLPERFRKGFPARRGLKAAHNFYGEARKAKQRNSRPNESRANRSQMPA